jgi:hypothetical protein
MTVMTAPPPTSPHFAERTVASAPAKPDSEARLEKMFGCKPITLRVPEEKPRKGWLLSLNVDPNKGFMFEVNKGRVEATWWIVEYDPTGKWIPHRWEREAAAAEIVRKVAE